MLKTGFEYILTFILFFLNQHASFPPPISDVKTAGWEAKKVDFLHAEKTIYNRAEIRMETSVSCSEPEPKHE